MAQQNEGAKRPDVIAEIQIPSFRLDGCLAVVTGASQGIGRAIALGYALSGAEVVLVSRRRDVLCDVKRSIEASGGQGHVMVADVTVRQDLEGLSQSVSKLIEGRDARLVLVNNAGFSFTRPAMQVTEEDWDKVLGMHVKAPFFCSQMLGRLMIARGYGKIINLSSTWSESTNFGKSTYGLAKAAVSYMTAALSTEWAPQGVRVNAIAPSKTSGESWKTHPQDDARNQRLLERMKLGRFAQPLDMVGAAIFLASPASDFVTGQTLFVDGGFNAAG